MPHDPRHDVIFVGYQARGTPGEAIQTWGPRGGYVELDGERIVIRAGGRPCPAIQRMRIRTGWCASSRACAAGRPRCA
ncbi:hypothetical protein [Nitrogeniibacter mangrovi]|uniref:hypothetical protein n=1 Tax=Nitrogeniibacter mangrovi TaxID=2016596 RepID=UPI00226A0BF7|nr:hypothetical protein [Nitrogeniibacter mangrovi]